MRRIWVIALLWGITASAQDAGRWTYALFMLRDGLFDYRCAAVAVKKTESQTFMLTAAHCFSPGQTYALGDGVDEGPSIRADIYGLSADADLALFTIEAPLPAAPLGKDPKRHESVTMTGWPWGEKLTSYMGHVVDPDAFVSVHGTLLYITPYIVPGLSGSPIYCISQEAVCGILVSGFDGDPHFAGIVPISAYQGRWLTVQGD